jgi:hypothetical protein
MAQKTIWKTVKWKGITFPNHLVSNTGIVVTSNNVGRNRIKSPLFGEYKEMSYKISNRGYTSVYITAPGGKRYYPNLHQIVWESFNGEVPSHLCIDHSDNDKNNNTLNNLQLLTKKQNTIKYHRVDKLKA